VCGKKEREREMRNKGLKRINKSNTQMEQGWKEGHWYLAIYR